QPPPVSGEVHNTRRWKHDGHWLPGQGAIVTVKGQPQGEAFKEPEFFNALLGIWLGPKPADQQLKKALLGEAG
ncbi:MAG: chalcone isomerase family protein, partial [Comamonas sp.]|nr:chalcone isomerase family protein [Comamonas sp.]